MRRRPGPWTRLGALASAQVLYGTAGLEGPAPTQGMLTAILSTSVAEGAAAGGAGRRAWVPAVAGSTGFLAELIGVRTGLPFGRYRYTDRLGPRIGEVPVLAAAAWAAMARPAWVSAGWITASPGRRAALAASALTAWDVFLDPRMVHGGYWEWAAEGRYEGIPLSNFAGWWLTGLVAFGLVARLDPEPPSGRDDAALGLYVWTWLGETVANALIWRRPRVARAGAVAMGVHALGALAGRRSRR